MKIVERVTRRVVRRLREDAEQDRLFRQQAIDVYKQLVEYLKSGGEFFQEGAARTVQIDQFTSLEDRAPVPLKIKWYDKDMASADARYVKAGGDPEIRLYVLDRAIFDSKKDARRAMRRGLENISKVFMHEYIHYLDDRRTEANIQDLARYDPGGGKQWETYFTDPVEVNAYFQSGLAQLEHTLEVPGLLDTRMKRDWNNNFRDFKDWFFEEHIPEDMEYYISDDQRKRLINRLYGFWNRIEDEYNDI